MNVPSVNVPGVNVPNVNVPSRTLAARTMPEIRSRCVRVLSGRHTTAYDVCADVLFAFNRANVRPRAASALDQIARSIRKRFPGRPIEVDGHTDAKGSADYNDRLSPRRARAVGAGSPNTGDCRGRA